jgi:hypothetical protein
MSHIDQYRSTGTCQTCREPKRVSGVGTVRRHRLPSGNWCPGGGCLSIEDAAEEAARRAAADRRLVPSGCTWCGIPEYSHARQWVPAVGLHEYTPPDVREIKDRMLTRRRATIEAGLPVTAGGA